MQETNANKVSSDSEETEELRNQHRQETLKTRTPKRDERHRDERHWDEKEEPCFVLGYN
ncbi:hypothetical protein [Thalassotalea litorea]|uniref:hypothetical protein n=1 Tax=Thalassotalea litorea TaxID=2020715 RepID=UPI0014857632|nr:hypothetical protein [Thalassotalea litorea]